MNIVPVHADAHALCEYFQCKMGDAERERERERAERKREEETAHRKWMCSYTEGKKGKV